MSESFHRQRALRYALECAMKFRCSADAEWRDGWLRNISETGLLFQPRALVADDVRLEIAIDLPSPGIGSIWCTAVIARRVETSEEVAARITDYRLMPRGAAEA